ncbi:MAG: thymidine phosphorylase [Ignavibacteria bacterium GWA2_55_25]|nr:MAG: thymidine phosphorylase [Ignavibacteria bacterium GWA2_55_25]
MFHEPIDGEDPLNVVELIRKKREGKSLTEEEFRFLLSGYVEGRVPDYQVSSFLMACYFQGMSEEETFVFTEVMLHSGEAVDLSDVPGVKVDKHSTGGVGDKISLLVAPIVAACGVPVPMISGRGLGHTGGTLDKLDSIPGFRTNLSIAEYRRIIREIGVVMIGQTSEIAPADKKIYALRDVTGTIESIPLIASSIMSKKLATGINGLVLDVKTGRGAFMQTPEDSTRLAEMMVRIGNHFGLETMAFITDMSQPLGMTIGNWLEMVESVECLRGTRGIGDASSDLMELTHLLAAHMLLLGKRVKRYEEGIALSKQSVKDGSAYRKFLELVAVQGGDVSVIENLEGYPLSDHIIEIRIREGGFVAEIDPLELGMTSILLGAGRQRAEDLIDHKAGIILKKRVGERVEDREVVALFHTDREEVIPAARERITNAFLVTATEPTRPPLIRTMIDKEGVHDWP